MADASNFDNNKFLLFDCLRRHQSRYNDTPGNIWTINSRKCFCSTITIAIRSDQMKSILKLSVGALAFSSVLAAPAHAEFSDVGTAYSKATVDRWSDDQINMFVEKAN